MTNQKSLCIHLRLTSLIVFLWISAFTQMAQSSSTDSCSVRGRVQNFAGIIKFCDGTYWQSMKSAQLYGQGPVAPSTVGQTQFLGTNISFWDGGSSWSMVSNVLGGCSVNGRTAFIGNVMTVCLQGTLRCMKAGGCP